MRRYSVEPKEIFVKVFGSLSCAKSMAENISKNVSKRLNSKYSQKLLDRAKQSATETFKTSSKRVIQITAEATNDLIGNKVAENN